jgi:plasmid maintenance system killer protein
LSGESPDAYRGVGRHRRIRVNDPWRICFVWRNNEAWDVEIIDYH